MATVKDFRYWQERGAWHELTCEHGHAHAALIPQEADVEGGVLLVCPDCDYTQVPAPYLHAIAESMREYTERFLPRPS